MVAASWQERWRIGQIGFHQANVEPNLERHWPRLALPTDAFIFVPLCGKSLDLAWLTSRGHRVLGVDLSPIALEDYLLETGVAAMRRPREALNEYVAGTLRLLCGDFFELSPQLTGSPTAIYDRAALVALDAPMRPKYVAKLCSLTQPGTRTLLITLEYPQAQTVGPPFSVSQDEVRALYGREHRIEILSTDDTLASDARMRTRGVTTLFQTCYLMERL